MENKEMLSRRTMAIEPSGIRRFFDLCVGRDDVISLGVGEPDFSTPYLMREQAIYYLQKGRTSYTTNRGLLSLRKEICRYLQRYSMEYNPVDEVLITIGVSEAIDVILRSVLNPGDEIIVCEPCYVSYRPLAELCETKLVHVDTSNTDFYITAAALEKVITPRTKALMLSSPNNPTGKMIPKEELEKIAALAKKHKFWCISDEVYCELTYENVKHTSIGSFEGMKDYSVILNGFSKSFAMTGWRIGFVAAPKFLIDQAHKIHQYSAICAPIMSQYAAEEGLKNGWGDVETMRVSYRQRRNFFCSRLEKMGLSYSKPDGAFYIFTDIRSTGLSSEEFSRRLIEEKNVAVVPGSVFGAGGEGFVRCCYATALDKLRIALDRMEEFVKEL